MPQKPRYRTNTGKQTIHAMAANIWQELPPDIKHLTTYSFKKQVRQWAFSLCMGKPVGRRFVQMVSKNPQ